MTLVLSLFPGIGLLDMAFEEEGFCVVRGPDLLWGGDIRKFSPPAGKFDGVIGGPPCQAFSPLKHLLFATGRTPKHGNLIPEYERVVGEAAPAWWLMENVVAAPEPSIAGYAIRSFRLCPTWLGEAQRRLRRFTFGIRREQPVDLRQFIEYAALELPETAYTVTGRWVDNSDEAKGRVKTQAVCGDRRAVPVAIGGSDKVKVRAVRGKNDGNPQPWEIANGRFPSGHPGYRRSWAEMCELQGLSPTFLNDSPLTADGKKAALGNGVPLPMGRAIAKAVKRAVS
jgi:DNA (cytosine-5)-methyltransferase 1